MSYPQPIPPDACGHDTHARPLDPFSGGQVTIACAFRSDRPKHRTVPCALPSDRPRHPGSRFATRRSTVRLTPSTSAGDLYLQCTSGSRRSSRVTPPSCSVVEAIDPPGLAETLARPGFPLPWTERAGEAGPQRWPEGPVGRRPADDLRRERRGLIRSEAVRLCAEGWRLSVARWSP